MKSKTTLLAAALLFTSATAGLHAADVFHFALNRSAPAADAALAAPAEVRLWFTEAPADNSVRIRIVNRAGEAVATSAVAADPENAAVFFVKPAAPLSVGPYTVSWRGVGDDGHPVTGDFAFTVTAQ